MKRHEISALQTNRKNPKIHDTSRNNKSVFRIEKVGRRPSPNAILVENVTFWKVVGDLQRLGTMRSLRTHMEQ